MAKPTYPSTPIAAAASSVTLPSHAVGDLLIIGAYNNAAATIATTPAASGTVPAWSVLDGPAGANLNSLKVATFVATATNHTSGTWTNATNMVAVVMRGVSATPTTTGHAQGGSAVANSCVAPATTLTVTDGSSACVSIIFHKSATAWGSAPTGYTQQLASTTGLCVVLDLTTTTSSPGSVTQTDTSASGGYRGETFEVLAGGSSATVTSVAASAPASAPVPVPLTSLAPAAVSAPASAPVSVPTVALSPAASSAPASIPVPSVTFGGSVTAVAASAPASAPVAAFTLLLAPGASSAAASIPQVTAGAITSASVSAVAASAPASAPVPVSSSVVTVVCASGSATVRFPDQAGSVLRLDPSAEVSVSLSAAVEASLVLIPAEH